MFKDHFSGHAKDYSAARPHYPDELFAYLASLVKQHQLAWDCATGNGQAAIKLAHYFTRVVATDASEAQIKNAIFKKNIEYRVALAEDSDLETNSVDLVTVAQALHWFDFEKFYKEVKRVLKPQGLLAVWAYELLTCDNDEINNCINIFYTEIIGKYWPPEREYINQSYETIPFPFEKITTPEFSIKLTWTFDQLLNYLSTWSAVKNYERDLNEDPVQTWFKPRASKYFIEQKSVVFTMPLIIKVGQVQSI